MDTSKWNIKHDDDDERRKPKRRKDKSVNFKSVNPLLVFSAVFGFESFKILLSGKLQN